MGLNKRKAKLKLCLGFNPTRCQTCKRQDDNIKTRLVESLSTNNTCVHYIYKTK